MNVPSARTGAFMKTLNVYGTSFIGMPYGESASIRLPRQVALPIALSP
jgi:hypothetical protein